MTPGKTPPDIDTNGGHLDDETLSELVDVGSRVDAGNSASIASARAPGPTVAPSPSSDPASEQHDLAARAHLSGCAECRRRLDLMSAAADLLRERVSLPDLETKRRAVAAAVDAAAMVGAGVSAPPSPGVQRWYRRSTVLVAAAASFVGIVLAVSLVLTNQGSPNSAAISKLSQSNSAAVNGPSHGTTAKGSAGFGPSRRSEPAYVLPGSASSQAALPTTGIPNLGSVASTAQLVTRLRQQASSTSGGASSAGGASGSGSASPTAGAHQSASGADSLEYGTCLRQTQQDVHASNSEPGLVATATFKGTSAWVLEFWPSSSESAGTTKVAVVSESSCKLLALTSI